MKRALTAAAAVLALTGALFAAEPYAMKAPVLPEDVFAVLEIPSLENVQSHLQGYANTVSPGTTVPPLTAVFMNLTKTRMPTVIDASRPIRLLLVAAGDASPERVLVFSVTDTAAYLASLMPTLQQQEDAGNIKTYLESKRSFDRKAFKQATPEEKRDFQRFMKVKELSVVIATEGKTVCIAKSKVPLGPTLAFLRSGKLGAQPLMPGGDAAVYVRVKPLLTRLAKQKGELFGGLRKRMETMMPAAENKAAMDPAQIKAIWDVELDALEKLMGQVESFSARMTVDNQNIALAFGLRAVDESGLAGYLESIPPGQPPTLKYVPDDAFLVMATRVGNMQPLMAWAMEFQTKVAATMGQDQAGSQELAAVTQDILTAYGDDLTFAMRAGKGMRALYVLRLRDVQARERLAKALPALVKPMMGMYKSMGVTAGLEVKPDALEHKGHKITEWRYTLDMKAPADATPEMVAAYAQQQKAMKAMFGDAMVFYGAVQDSDWLLTLGADSLDALKAVLDGAEKKLTQRPGFKQAMATLPAERKGLALLHLTDMLQWALLLAAEASEPNPMRQKLLGMTFERGPGIVGGFYSTGSQGACEVRIPAQEIKNIADGFTRGRAAAAQPAPPPP